MSFYLYVPGSMSNDDALKLALVYLFISVEHKITDAEMEKFFVIGRAVKGWGAAKGTIIEECEKLLSGKESESVDTLELRVLAGSIANKNIPAHTKHLKRKRESRIESIVEVFTETAQAIDDDEGKVQRTLLSWFVNLMYGDGLVSEQRLRLAKLWCEKCKLDQSVFDEMKDIVETGAILEKTRSWISTSKDSEAEAVLLEIEKNLKETEESMSNLVALG